MFWQRRYEPAVIARDRQVEAALRQAGHLAQGSPGALLFEPEEVRAGNGRPFQVFTAFWRACGELSPHQVARAASAPASLPGPRAWPRSVELESLGLEPPAGVAATLRERWRPGERGAWRALRRFLTEGLSNRSTCVRI